MRRERQQKRKDSEGMKIRHWLIKVLAGEAPIALNLTVYGTLELTKPDGFVDSCIFYPYTEPKTQDFVIPERIRELQQKWQAEQ